MPSIDAVIVQYDIEWKDKDKNFRKIETLLDGVTADLVILPEMFQTGFCTDDHQLAEKQNGQSAMFMQRLAAKCGGAVCGSLLIIEEEKYFNRFLVVTKDGVIDSYDKMHLFSMASEGEFFTPGEVKTDFVIKGFRIRPIICYDLRFPYLSFNDSDYDVLVVVANWPKRRILQWDQLLTARAIENQAYVLAANRTGLDGLDFEYNGHSRFINPMGINLVDSESEEILRFTLQQEEIQEVRTKLPFLKDRKV